MNWTELLLKHLSALRWLKPTSIDNVLTVGDSFLILHSSTPIVHFVNGGLIISNVRKRKRARGKKKAWCIQSSEQIFSFQNSFV